MKIIAALIIALVFGLMLFNPSVSLAGDYLFLYFDWMGGRREIIIKIK